jgi:hypothetical protein
MAAVAELLARVRAELGARHLVSSFASDASSADSAAGLALDWPGLEELLPGGALPGGVVELSSPGAHPSTAFAVRAVRAAHARVAGAWCAWIDPERTLYAPGLLVGGVDLARLLVVTPPRTDLGRVAVKLVGSGAFDVVVVDMDAIDAAGIGPAGSGATPARSGAPVRRTRRREFPPEVLVRKLALAAEDGKTHVLLLTAREKARSTSWPVGMRLEVARLPAGFAVTVAKTRHGSIGNIGSTGAHAELPLLAHQVAAPSIVKAGARANITPIDQVSRARLRARFAG